MIENEFTYFHSWLQSLELLAPGACAYFSEKVSQVKAFLADKPLPLEIIDSLLAQGYRRSGEIFYQNHCPGCHLCLSLRIPLKTFSATGSQKRILKKNRDLVFKIGEPRSTKQKKIIYLRYQHQKHYLHPALESKRKEYFDMHANLEIMHEQMYKITHQSKEMEIWLDDILLGFGILDLGLKAMSMVYLVFEPRFQKRSPGKFIILKALEWARDAGFKYAYLGFYIPGNRKMDYKIQYGPAQILNPVTMQWENSGSHELMKLQEG
jgi:arginine-tRNA-protein transferase